MEFEQTNDHHLLVFDSTDNFSKIAGRSVLFYTLTIADRIHRRYSVKNDSDDYSRSEDGVVSIRAIEQLPKSISSPTASSVLMSFIFINYPKSTTTNKSLNSATAHIRISSALLQLFFPLRPFPNSIL